MSWNYNVNQVSTTPLYQVRALIQDVNPTDKLLEDEEINFFLTQRDGSIYGASANACRAIAAKFSRRANTTMQGMSVTYQNQASAYAKRADEFDGLDASDPGGVGMPYAGGISQADKQTYEGDTDRTGPQFTIGMNDNLSDGGGTEKPETLTGT